MAEGNPALRPGAATVRALGVSTAAIAETAATSGARPSSRTSPVTPHTSSTLPGPDSARA